jgi:hypothetical protein
MDVETHSLVRRMGFLVEILSYAGFEIEFPCSLDK